MVVRRQNATFMSSENSNTELLNYLPLVVGWALGILSALAVDGIKKWFLRRETKRGILTELRDLQNQATLLCILTTTRSRNVTPAWSKWVRPYCLNAYNPDDLIRTGLEEDDTSVISKMSEDEFHQFMLLWQSRERPGVSQTFSPISLPYLDSKYDFLSHYDQDFQLLIAKVRKQVDVLNNDFSQCWFYHSKTFDNITDSNHDIAVRNIDEIIGRISRRAKGIVVLVQAIFDS